MFFVVATLTKISQTQGTSAIIDKPITIFSAASNIVFEFSLSLFIIVFYKISKFLRKLI